MKNPETSQNLVVFFRKIPWSGTEQTKRPLFLFRLPKLLFFLNCSAASCRPMLCLGLNTFFFVPASAEHIKSNLKKLYLSFFQATSSNSQNNFVQEKITFNLTFAQPPGGLAYIRSSRLSQSTRALLPCLKITKSAFRACQILKEQA